MMKTPKEIRDELLSSYMELEKMYAENMPDSDRSSLNYSMMKFSEFLLKETKELIKRTTADVKKFKFKKNWNSELKKSSKVISKYGNIDKFNIKIKSQFDLQTYNETVNFIDGMQQNDAQ